MVFKGDTGCQSWKIIVKKNFLSYKTIKTKKKYLRFYTVIAKVNSNLVTKFKKYIYYIEWVTDYTNFDVFMKIHVYFNSFIYIYFIVKLVKKIICIHKTKINTFLKKLTWYFKYMMSYRYWNLWF